MFAANLWTDRFGNTYHKVYLTVGPKTISSEIHYSEDYEFTACRMLARVLKVEYRDEPRVEFEKIHNLSLLDCGATKVRTKRNL